MPPTLQSSTSELQAASATAQEPRHGYFLGITVAVLLTASFWPILVSMYGSWFDERSYMEHGILVIPAAICMAWMKRERLKQISCTPSYWGLVLLLWGAVQATLGTAAHWIWFSRMAFLISLVGGISIVYGLQAVRVLAYPLSMLALMIAPPTFVYERVTLDLQLLASRLGEFFLEALGYSVMREGNILELVGAKLSIEEACSGIRSLISILFMCTLYNYFFVRGNAKRALILCFAVPIAILGNAGRIVATGIASQYNRALIQGTAHEAFGYFSIIIAGIGCILIHQFLLYIDRMRRVQHA